MSLPIRLSLFYAAFFAVAGIQMPFWPLWLQGRGLGPTEIAIVMTVALWVRVASTPVIANWVDRTGRRNSALIALSWICVFVFATQAFTATFWPILIVGSVFAMLRGSLLPLGDSIVLLLAGQNRLDYGRLRVWGSVSFLAVTLLGGLILRGQDTELILHTVVVLLAIAALSVHVLPAAETQPAQTARAPVLRVLANPTFMLFLLATSSIAGSHAVFYAFGSLHWRALGLDAFTIGILWAVGVVAEIAVFIWARPLLERTGPAWLILAGGLFALPRWIITARAEDPLLIAGMQVLHAATFGLAHVGAMQFIARATPPDVSASAQGLLATANAGIALGFATLASGPLYAAFGGDAYFAMAAMGGAGAVAAFALLRIWQGNQLKI